MEINYTDHALKQLKKIARGDKKKAERIIAAAEDYAENPQRHPNVKRLKGEHEDLIRLRTGDYRIIFVIENDKMIIAEIKHRQGAYND